VGAQLVMYQPSPNPFSSQTTIAFEIPSSGTVQVKIFDASGRLVRNLVNGEQGAGLHSLLFDGRDDNGAAISAGVYYLHVMTEGSSVTEKLLLLN